MAIELDNLHYNWRIIDGYNKAFNFVMSPRELGKTTMMWFTKIYQPFKKDKKPWIYLVRQTVEITDALIDSIFEVNIKKFTDDDFKYFYKAGSFKDGIVDVYISFGEDDTRYLFFRIVSLSIRIRRIKLAVLKDIKGVFMDEYIINPRSGEKYEEGEAFKIKEAYTTWRRECDGILKVYFSANPYSIFNPLFVDWGVDTKRLKKNDFYVGDIFVIHWGVLSKELREHILEVNPLYKFDEDYNEYALEGSAINDSNIRLDKLPQNYPLAFVFRYEGKNIGIFKNNYFEDHEDRYFCKFLDNVSARRTSFAFNFEDLVERTAIISMDDRMKFRSFKDAMRRNKVSFEDVNVYYYIIEIYKNL